MEEKLLAVQNKDSLMAPILMQRGIAEFDDVDDM